MPRTFMYTCDECGKVKGESNHWMVAHETEFGIDGQLTSVNSLRIRPMGSVDETGMICSPACAHKRLDKFIDKLRKQMQDAKKEDSYREVGM